MKDGRLDGIDRDKLVKIANMSLMGVSSRDICAVVGVQEANLHLVKETQEYSEIYGALVTEKHEDAIELNDGWDAVEKTAMTTVLASLNATKNPDFALRAALIANKAVRRGTTKANMALSAEVGQVVVLNLNQNFVNRVQQTGIDARSITGGISRPAIEGQSTVITKQEDVMTPQRVENILSLPKVKGVESNIIEMVANVLKAAGEYPLDGLLNSDSAMAAAE